MHKPKILIVASSLFIGGAEVVIQSLCRNLDRSSFEVIICHLKQRGNLGDELAGEGYHLVGIPKSNILKADYLSFLKLLKIVRKYKIDLIHSHTTHSLSDSALCKIFSPGLKFVHTFHFGNYPHDKKSRMTLERLFWRFTDRLVAVGETQKKTVQDTYKIPDQRIMTIRNGVALKKGAPDSDFVSRYGFKDRVLIGSIGTLFEQKGFTYLLDVAYELKKRNCRAGFLIAGEGPLRGQLEAKMKALGLEDDVRFLGWVKDADIHILPNVDIFFQPSLWEAMSVVVLEAMAASKPVVATSVGENCHVLEHDRDGLLVRPKDIEGMTLALMRLIQDPILRRTLGANARAKIESRFTAQHMTRAYEELYFKTLAKNTGNR